MRKQVLTKCNYCSIYFLKAHSEIKRSKNGKHYCCMSCARNCRIDKIYNMYNISQDVNNKLSDYTCYRWYMKCIKSRSNYEDITLQDLDVIWKKQQGICPYTNIKLRLKTHSDNAISTFDNPFEFAPIDRIDSSKGYTIDNIEFVSVGINYLKHIYTKEQTIAFINFIKKHK